MLLTDMDPPAASTRSRMWLSGSCPPSPPVTSTRKSSPRAESATFTGSARSRVASATQKYAAASTLGSKRRPSAWWSTTRRRAPPVLVKRDWRAVGSPERASWAGKTPRVISRRDSSAEFNASTKGSSRAWRDTVLRAVDHRQLSQPLRQRPQMGEDLPGDGPLETAPLGIAGADQTATRVTQLTSALVQPFHLARQLEGEPRIAKCQSCLVGQVSEELLLAPAQRMPGRHRQGDAPEAFPQVQDRHLQPGSLRVARWPGWPGRRLVGPGVHVEHGHDPGRVDGTGRGLGHCREQRRGVRAAAESPSEVGERFVRRGRGAERHPVRQPDDPAPKGLEGQRDQGGREQRGPETAGSTVHRQADRHDHEHVAGSDQDGGNGQDHGAIDDQVDLQQPVAEHRDGHAERHGDLGHPQR